MDVLKENGAVKIKDLSGINGVVAKVSKGNKLGNDKNIAYIENDSTHSIILKNKFVLPGLIDAHVHFATDPTEERRDDAEKVLKEMLLTGVTSVRDMAGDTRALSSLSRNTLVGDIDGPNIYYSAIMAGPKFFSDPRTIATAQGGISGKMPYMKAIDSTSNLILEVAQARGTGASGIKLYANLPSQEINNIVKEAKKQGINVWAHAALTPTKPSDVISSGVISVSHVDMLLYEYFKSRKELVDKWTISENDTKSSKSGIVHLLEGLPVCGPAEIHV